MHPRSKHVVFFGAWSLSSLLAACSGDDTAGTALGGNGGSVSASGASTGGTTTNVAGQSSNGGAGGSMVSGGGGGGGLGGTVAGGGSSGGAGTGGAGAGGAGASSGGAGASNGGAGGSNAGAGGASGGAGGSAGSSTGGTTNGGAGGAGNCGKPTAPSALQNTLDLTWKEMIGGFEGKTGARPKSASIQTFKNAVLDQVMESGGKLNFCVRYESNTQVTAAQRDKVLAALRRGVDEWFGKLKGHDCFPFEQITTNITGWATVNRSTFDWADGVVPLFINQIGYENVAQCPDACSRFVRYHAGQSTKGYAYPGCTGGADNRFDMHLWLTEGMGFGGAGGDWGQRLDRAYFMQSVDDAHQHIWLHEFGHGFGFPDYYNWDVWAPGVASPNSVMVAGVGLQVTEWDTWMLRATYSNLKSRWQ